MEVIEGHRQLPVGQWRCGAVTLGVFDGVHVGHQAVLRRTRERAGDLPAAAVTFDRHPRSVVGDGAPAQIAPLSARLEAIAACGIDRCLVLRFDAQLAATPPADFAREVLIERVGAARAVLGYDCRFGRGGEGDAAWLAASGLLPCETAPPLDVDGVAVSSTRVREAIRAGDLDRLRALLGRPLTLGGAIIRGDGRGRQLGFPTANVDHAGYLLPPTGVYAGRAWIPGHGDRWRAIANLGTRPTFDDSERVWLEVHLLDHSADLYGQQLRVSLEFKLRDEQRFDSAEALLAQIREDRQRALTVGLR